VIGERWNVTDRVCERMYERDTPERALRRMRWMEQVQGGDDDAYRCSRADHRPERIQGTVIYLPAGTYGSKRTLRVRARIEHFDREQYGVTPKNTPGWLARVQQLADVVGTEGTIEVNLFATTPDGAGGETQQ